MRCKLCGEKMIECGFKGSNFRWECRSCYLSYYPLTSYLSTGKHGWYKYKGYCENCNAELTQEEIQTGTGTMCNDCNIPDGDHFA